MTTQRAPSRRIQPRGPESGTDRLAIIATVAVVLVAVIVIAIGYYFTRYLPPREHVLTVDEQKFTARDIERRAVYLLLSEPALAPRDPLEIVPKTFDQFEREAIIRARANAVVGDLTAEDLEREMRTLFLPPQPTLSSAATGAGIASATPTPLPDDQYAKALSLRLDRTGISKAELEQIVYAQVLEKRLKEHLVKELPKAGLQLHFAVARLTDRAKADQVREVVLRPGVDFGQVAEVNSASDSGPIGDLDWMLPQELRESIRTVAVAMKPGDVSAVTPNQQFFEVYKVIARDEEREFTADQRDKLAAERLTAWLGEQRADLQVQRDLSSAEDEWIRNQAVARYTKAVRQPSAP